MNILADTTFSFNKGYIHFLSNIKLRTKRIYLKYIIRFDFFSYRDDII